MEWNGIIEKQSFTQQSKYTCKLCCLKHQRKTKVSDILVGGDFGHVVTRRKRDTT
jgi:hypothetical protein